ncbi:hypothetical protein ACQZF5_05330 [Corynebacterium diphtheriae]
MSKRGMTAERAQRAQKVVQLHEDGATFDVIAKHLGISQTRARDDYNRAMKEAIPDVAQTFSVRWIVASTNSTSCTGSGHVRVI